MKCVGYRPTGGVFRTSDAEATKLVEQGAGMWVYDCKKGWKSQGRMTSIQQVVDFKPSQMPKKLGKVLTMPEVCKENEKAVEEATVKKPKFKKGATKKKTVLKD